MFTQHDILCSVLFHRSLVLQSLLSSILVLARKRVSRRQPVRSIFSFKHSLLVVFLIGISLLNCCTNCIRNLCFHTLGDPTSWHSTRCMSSVLPRPNPRSPLSVDKLPIVFAPQVCACVHPRCIIACAYSVIRIRMFRG